MKLETRLGVFIAAALTSLVAIGLAVFLSLLLYPPEISELILKYTPIIGGVISFPISLFVWSQVRHTKQLGAQYQRLLRRDRLTGVATRDYFFEQIESGPPVPGVMLMIDVDHFKSVNDRFGHYFGDTVIRQVATVLANNCRDDDIVCRFGGEEFMIFLRDASIDRGRAVAERILRAVQSEVIRSDTETVNVTVSIGGAVKTRSEPAARSLRLADDALYSAKRAGRNRFEACWTDQAA